MEGAKGILQNRKEPRKASCKRRNHCSLHPGAAEGILPNNSHSPCFFFNLGRRNVQVSSSQRNGHMAALHRPGTGHV